MKMAVLIGALIFSFAAALAHELDSPPRTTNNNLFRNLSKLDARAAPPTSPRRSERTTRLKKASTNSGVLEDKLTNISSTSPPSTKIAIVARTGAKIILPICARTNCSTPVSSCQKHIEGSSASQQAISPRQPEQASLRCHGSFYDPGKSSVPTTTDPNPLHYPQSPPSSRSHATDCRRRSNQLPALDLPTRYRHNPNVWYLRVIDLEHPLGRREVETERFVAPPNELPHTTPDMPIIETDDSLWQVVHVFPPWIIREFARGAYHTALNQTYTEAGNREDLWDLWTSVGEEGEVSLPLSIYGCSGFALLSWCRKGSAVWKLM